MCSSPADSGAVALTAPPRSRLDRTGELTPLPQDALLWSRAEGYTLELGGQLRQVSVRYQAYGRLNPQRDNAILIFHALSGSAHLAGRYPDPVWARLSPGEPTFGREGWWDALVGPGKLFDTERYYVICANHLGSCYGSTGPLTRDLTNGRRYGPDFPTVTVRDLARVQARLLDRLEVNRATLVGGSLGGMVALEFALLFPERSQRLLLLAAPGHHGPWARAWNRLAREAIRQDPAYHAGRYHQQPGGLALARTIALLSYRAPASFELRWGAEPLAGEHYLLHQGEKFLDCFDTNSYLVLSTAMDTHDVGRGRGGLKKALRQLRCQRCSSASTPIFSIRRRKLKNWREWPEPTLPGCTVRMGTTPFSLKPSRWRNCWRPICPQPDRPVRNGLYGTSAPLPPFSPGPITWLD